MSTSGDTSLKPKQIKALAALAAGLSDAEAGALCKAAPSTVHAWRRLPAFSSELDRLLRIQRDRIQAALGSCAERAVTRLSEALDAVDPETGMALQGVRLRAAETTLGNFARVSQRQVDAGMTLPAGPLIVLPAGTQRIALVADTGPAQPAGDGGHGQAQPPQRSVPRETSRFTERFTPQANDRVEVATVLRSLPPAGRLESGPIDVTPSGSSTAKPSGSAGSSVTPPRAPAVAPTMPSWFKPLAPPRR
jgi:hypothetical protein